MREYSSKNDIEHWLSLIRLRFAKRAPHLLSLFDVYAAEAIFGRQYISADLTVLSAGARILEVGAGSFLLSIQLVREGYAVTALEPIGDGFSHFQEMRKIILEEGVAKDSQPVIIDIPVEELDFDSYFDYSYSVNVMEHVDDVEKAISKVGRGLVAGACYRFTCPNYLFPYEPHFNIPTLFSKVLTEKILGRKIFASRSMPDPVGTWKSLNWINVIQVRRIVRKHSELSPIFNRSMLVTTFERIATDAVFAERRSPLIRSLIGLLVRFRVHKLFVLLPASLHPVMDCRIKKNNSKVSQWRR